MLDGRTDLNALSGVPGTSNPKCNMLDSSHPEVAAYLGDCEQYYQSTSTEGKFKLCYWSESPSGGDDRCMPYTVQGCS